MDEYIFFDAGLRDRFVQFLETLSTPCELKDDTMGMIVAVPEDLPEETADAIEAHYESLEEAQSELMAESGDLKQLAGVRVALPDGRQIMVPVQADIAKRLFAAFSIEEVQALFDTVARHTLTPPETDHLCQILRAEAQKA
jgi:hypothetical protein